MVLAASAVLVASGQPATASADTARIVPGGPGRPDGATEATIAITGVDGSVRTLGPYRYGAPPSALRRSPDGRYFAVLWGGWSSDDRGLTIVPTDGRAPFEVPPLTRRGGPYDTEPENLSWSLDSREVVLGNTDSDNGPVAEVVLRCSIEPRRCAAIPEVDGFAATVPGGIVTSTALHAHMGWTTGFGPGDSEAVDPATVRELRKRRSSTTALVGDRPRTLVTRRTNILEGVQGAVAIVGGPSGALITEGRYRLRLVKRRVTRRASNAPRWTLVGPSGRVRTVVAPRLTVPKADSAPIGDDDYFLGRIRSQRAFPRPRAPIATGGWLAVTGAPTAVGGTEGLVLTSITRGGRAAFVRVGGRVASAMHLVRTVVGRTPTRGAASLDVVGHEAATNAAIVTLGWSEQPLPKIDRLPDGSIDPYGAMESPADEDDGPRLATVRIPLDGRTPPTVINHEHEGAAW